MATNSQSKPHFTYSEADFKYLRKLKRRVKRSFRGFRRRWEIRAMEEQPHNKFTKVFIMKALSEEF